MRRPVIEPLDETWRERLDAIARRHQFPTTREPAALARCVARLSTTYNDTAAAKVASSDATSLAARLGFSFPRDVPKGAEAARELIAAGRLRLDGGRLRMLDVGCGLGATSWGVAMAIAQAGGSGSIEIHGVDAEARALGLAQEIAASCANVGRGGGEGNVAVTARFVARPARDLGAAVRTLSPPGSYDLVLFGQVLSELDREKPDDVRVEAHVAVLEAAAAELAAGGSILVVEPALRDRTRHLHRVRDRLVERGCVNIFAPCVGSAGTCPMLAKETDWCHEDRPVDLPAWLVPVARGAGLRWQGLTFSYLVLRADGASFAGGTALRHEAQPRAEPRTRPLRVVSEPRVTKGKREAILCGAAFAPQPTHASGPANHDASRAAQVTMELFATMRLDREASPENAAWGDLRRGDVIALEPSSKTPRRIGMHDDVRVLSTGDGEGGD